MEAVLSHFHPFIKDWFEKRHHSPTDIQLQSWPLIASGEHLLITAPTGSGKTLTAFLWAINQLVSGEWSCGQPRVLYVSPLKALNNDIRRNLIQPLEEIRSIFKAAGQSFPDIRVFTRSGDTPQSERRRMLRHPPEILITTPESLNLLFSSKSGLQLFTALTTVILDEIHAVIGEKRGVHLITAVDRLIRLSGEFQRIALSATVNPLEPVAAFVGGYQKTGSSNAPSYQPREVRIVRSDQFESKRQRLADGYAPQSARVLVDWGKERLLIPEGEWERLLAAIERDHPENGTIESATSSKLARFKPPMARESLIAALKMVPSIHHCFFPELAKEAFRSLDGSPMPEIPSASERDDPTLLFAEWFQFYGPRSQAFFESTLGLAGEQIETMLQALIEERTLISGDLISDQRQSCFCDSKTFEILLRQNRSRAKPVFQALPIEKLPLFMARQQGLIASGNTINDLFQALERLVCLPLPADIWESDVFPSRIDSYQASFLDTIIQEGDLCWVVTGKQRIAFCFQTDWDMMQHPPKEETEPAEDGEAFPESLYMQTLLEGKEGRFHFTGLQQMSGRTPAELAEAIWQAVWSGYLSNDSFASLRKGIENRFRFIPVLHQESIQVRRGRRSAGRAAFAQWKDTLPYAGNWYLVPDAGPSDDLIEQEELNKDRVRLLLERYGLIFRELLARELPQFFWRALFRSLRLMELSGEILAGFFFKGITGPQFISQQAFRALQQPFPETAVYWMCAADPASLCGLQIESLKPSLPRRLSTTHLVFRGSELMLVSERSGKSLNIHCPPDDPRLQAYLAPLKHLLYRSFMPYKQIVIEEINQEAAAGSPYLDALKISFEVLPEFKKITLYRQI